MNLHDEIAATVRDIPDFPKPGIVFKDIGPLLRHSELLKKCISAMAKEAKSLGTQAVVGVESRGFLFGVPLALELGLPFIPARKKGKLPGKVVSASYQLEYGVDHIEIQADAIVPGHKYLVLDDVIATGGTAACVGKLIASQKGETCGYGFLIELGFLNGVKVLEETTPGARCFSLYRV